HRVADVPAPDRQALALALLQVAAPHDGPAGVTGEDAAAGLDLVVDVGEAEQPGDGAEERHEQAQAERVAVEPVAGDVPAAREDQPGALRRVVEHGLRGAGRVAVDAVRDQDGENPVAPGDRLPDHLAVVGRPRHDGDAALELLELLDALLPADADDLVAAVEAVADHVAPQLARRPDDADPLHDLSPLTPVRSHIDGILTLVRQSRPAPGENSCRHVRTGPR